jgi:hypothetical protein
MDVFRILLGRQSRPVRRDAQVRVTYDADGNPIVQPQQAGSFTLSETGSIDRLTVRRDEFYHCGCTRETRIGGQCGEPNCRRISCVRCFTRCDRCRKPLCLEHTRVTEFPGVKGKQWCFRCHDELSRLNLARIARQFFLPSKSAKKRK